MATLYTGKLKLILAIFAAAAAGALETLAVVDTADRRLDCQNWLTETDWLTDWFYGHYFYTSFLPKKEEKEDYKLVK